MNQGVLKELAFGDRVVLEAEDSNAYDSMAVKMLAKPERLHMGQISLSDRSMSCSRDR
jgi:hypothetical protein